MESPKKIVDFTAYRKKHRQKNEDEALLLEMGWVKIISKGNNRVYWKDPDCTSPLVSYNLQEAIEIAQLKFEYYFSYLRDKNWVINKKNQLWQHSYNKDIFYTTLQAVKIQGMWDEETKQ